MFTYIPFSVTQFLQGNKMVWKCNLFYLYFFTKNYFLWKPYKANFVFNGLFLFEIKKKCYWNCWLGLSKVEKKLGGCLDLIPSPLSSVKIQIMVGRITENLGLESPLRKVNFCLSFFSFTIYKTAYISLFITILFNILFFYFEIK